MDFFKKYKNLFITDNYEDFDNALEDALAYEHEISTILGTLQEISKIKKKFKDYKCYTHCHNIIHEIMVAKNALEVIQKKVKWIKKCSKANPRK